jgi:hypothetical protein
VRYLTRTLPKGSAATEAKAERCNVLQLLRLEVRYHRYSVFFRWRGSLPGTTGGTCQGIIKLTLPIL